MYTLLALTSLGAAASAASLSSLCTTSYVTANLPTIDGEGLPIGVTINSSSVTATIFTNYTVDDTIFWNNVTVDFCEIGFSYTHENQDDEFNVVYYMPTTENFQNRFLATGGAAYQINNGSGGADMTGGIAYGAATGYTDGGMPYYGSDNFDDVVLLGNGTANWPVIYSFAYQAIGEMTRIGKAFTANYFNVTNGNSTVGQAGLYSYYIGCSEGGREGMSQVQRNPELYDGIVVGAPAMRYGQQQVSHISPEVQIQTIGYYPGSCVFDTVINATINECDPMDGKRDGVVARSDLCLLNFDLNSLIGKNYSCTASTETAAGLGYGKKRQAPSTSATPAQNGTINAKDIEVIVDLLTGLKDSKGRRVYLPFQPAAGFGTTTVYDSTTDSWTITSPDSNTEWITKFLMWEDVSELPTMYGVTNDDLKAWMIGGMNKYYDSLQTTYPDLTAFYEKGGRMLHYHGEADTSVPPSGSIRYHESVRKIMYPGSTFEEGNDELNEWYRFYLVPGVAHCATNDQQPNAGFPRDNFAHMIDWVEKGITPETINATVDSGALEGEVQQVCTWPSRPYYVNDTLECQKDVASAQAFLWDLDAYLVPVY